MPEIRSLSSFGDRRLAQTWHNLHANPEWRVKQLAEDVELSVSRFQHLISERTGTTIRELKRPIKIKRLHEARRLLLKTDLPQKEIRYRAGYSQDSNFSRDFKRLFRQSPSELRRSKKKQRLPRRSRKSPK